MAELLPDFYTLTHTEPAGETGWAVRVVLNPLHPLYSGHFPQQPVVPGVCLLQMMKECLEKIYRKPLQYRQIASCKFLSAINPNETPELTFAFSIKSHEADELHVQAEGTSAKGLCLKLKAQLTGIQA